MYIKCFYFKLFVHTYVHTGHGTFHKYPFVKCSMTCMYVCVKQIMNVTINKGDLSDIFLDQNYISAHDISMGKLFVFVLVLVPISKSLSSTIPSFT